VKKWLATKHAVMFRLSNKIVQVDFRDKTRILLASETKVVMYLDKKGEKSSYPLATALESSNAEMVKRLRYTKEILTQMMQGKAGTHFTPESPLMSRFVATRPETAPPNQS
jgi:polo-like kinase 1